MRRLGGVARVSLSICSALLVAALALPSTALGAGSSITFGAAPAEEGLVLGDYCVNGHVPGEVKLHFVWKSSTGAVKANVYEGANERGDWGYCSYDGDVLAAGDLLKVTVGAKTRKFVVPLVTIRVDRVNDVFRGRAPSGTTLDLLWEHRGCCWDYSPSDTITVGDSGAWVFDGGSEHGPFGDVAGYNAYVDWTSAKGDRVSARGLAAEAKVRINRSTVAGYGHPFSDWKIALWDTASGVRKGVASGIVDDLGKFSGVFVGPNGQPVNVALGDKVIGRSLASDMKFVVRDVQATANVATDIVTGTSGYIFGGGHITVYRGARFKGESGFGPTDASGHFTVDFGEEWNLGYDPANIRHGDRLLVTSATWSGDFVVKGIPVP